MQGKATHSYPTISATIRAEIADAVGSGRRSAREAWSVGLVVVCAVLMAVGAVALALLR